MLDERNPTVNEEVLLGSFKDAMASLCSPVCVATTYLDGAPFGTTVSAVSSLSTSPPMLMLSLSQDSRLLASIRASRRFGINILASTQSAVAKAFATKGENKFDNVSWDFFDALPSIADAAAFVSCSLRSETEGGDHIVLFGEVDSVNLAPSSSGLTYFQRRMIATTNEHQ